MEWILELILIVLLIATLFHAIRLERALGVLKGDRAALQELVAGFNASTQTAEQGIGRLRLAADGAGRSIAKQIDTSHGLRDDLQLLTERGERLADRLEVLVRDGRALPQEMPAGAMLSSPVREAEDPPGFGGGRGEPRPKSQAERDLLRALRIVR